jgi:hypothetical protein
MNVKNLSSIPIQDLFDQAGDGLYIAEKEFNKILIDSNLDKKRRNVLLIDTERNVYIFKVEIASSNLASEKYKTYLCLKLQYNDLRLVSKSLVDFVEKNGIYYLAYSDEIIIWGSSRQINSLKLESTKLPNIIIESKIIDLHEVGNAIYVLIENYGLRSLDISNPENVHWNDFDFYHPHIQKIDSYYNPYFDYPFLALLVNNRHLENGSEFYIELSLKNEFQPLVYRHYLRDKYLDIKYIVSDEEFSYLFEQNSNSIFVFSRSITATSRNSVFKIALSEHLNIQNTTTTVFPFIIYDDTLKYKHLALLSDNKLIYSEEIQLKSAQLDITFNYVGNYTMELFTYSDYCNLPIQEVKMCKVFIKFEMHVTKSAPPFHILEFIINISLICTTIILLVLLYMIIFKFKKVKEWVKKNSYINLKYFNDTDYTYEGLIRRPLDSKIYKDL